MTYDNIKEWYSTIIEISKIFFKDDVSSLQITDSTFILIRGWDQIIITPDSPERTISMSSIENVFYDKDKIEDIESHEWFHLTILHKVPYSYECIKQLSTINKKFHILIGVND